MARKKKNETRIWYEALAKKYLPESVSMEDCPLAVQEYGNRHDTEVSKVGQLFVLVQVDSAPRSPRGWDNTGTIIGTPDRESVQGDRVRWGSSHVRRVEPKAWIVEHVNTDPDVYCFGTLDRNHRMGDVSFTARKKGEVTEDTYLDGVIVAYRQDVRKMWCGSKKSDAPLPARKRILEALKGEIEAYSDWATGNCHGYRIVDPDGNELDSCWGFLGDSEYAMKEGVSAARWLTEKYGSDDAVKERRWEERRRVLVDALAVLDPDNDPARDVRDELTASLNKATYKEGWTL